MTPGDVQAMPLGMRRVFEDFQANEIRERNKANSRRR